MTFPVGNFTSMTGWVQYGNTVTDNYFVNLLLLGLYIVVFVYMKSDNSQPTMNCFMYAGFLTSIVSILFFFGDMLPNQFVMFLYIILTIISAIAGWFYDGR